MKSIVVSACATLFLCGCGAEDGAAEDACASPTALARGGLTSTVCPEPPFPVWLGVHNQTSVLLERFALRFTSNLKDTIHDTLRVEAIAPDSTRAFYSGVGIALPSLRWWDIDVQVLDSLGAVFATGNAGPIPTGKSVGADAVIFISVGMSP